MKITKQYLIIVLAALILTVPARSRSAALDWDGQTGVFLNGLLTQRNLAALRLPRTTLTLAASARLPPTTLSRVLTTTWKSASPDNETSVNGIANQSVEQVKWQFLPEKKTTPAVAIWGLNRKALRRTVLTIEAGLTATKVIPIGRFPLVADVGLRSTTARGMGLFGVGNDRKVLAEGSLALFVTKNFAIGTEYKQQVDARPWHDIVFGDVASKNFNVYLGIASFATGINNQLALAVTYAR